MKALTLHQPWASLVAFGVKTVETRNWSTKYRGPLAIHAGKRCEVGPLGDFDVEDDTPRRSAKQYLLRGEALSWPYRVPLGAVLTTCELIDVVPTEDIQWVDEPTWDPMHWCQVTVGRTQTMIHERERPYGDYGSSRFAWLLKRTAPYSRPIEATGLQRLWNWTPTKGTP